MTWRKKTDPLYRGDASDSVMAPVPDANPSIVRHILYLDGYGRDTPYVSTTERTEVAALFAVRGRIWRTTAPLAEENGVTHIDNKQLLSLLKSKGKGRPSGPMHTRSYRRSATQNSTSSTFLTSSTSKTRPTLS